MRCCGSSTISIAAEAAALRRPQAGESAVARDVVSALLFREILKPLASGMGPVGEIALGAVADELFVRRQR